MVNVTELLVKPVLLTVHFPVLSVVQLELPVLPALQLPVTFAPLSSASLLLCA